MKKNFRKFQKISDVRSFGFSLVEMMVVVAVMGMVILGLISMSSQQIKLSKTMSDSASFNELRNLILQTMAYRSLCQNAAAPNGPVAIDMSAATTTSQAGGAEISFAVPGGVIQQGSDAPGNELKVQSFRVNNAFNTGATDPIAPLNKLWAAQLWLRVEHNGDVFGAKVLKERSWYITLSVNPASQLASCFMVADSGGGAASSNIIGTCPAGTMMTGITSTGVICNVTTAPIGGTSSPWTPSNPGPGCIGNSCVTSDFGPCNGNGCKTNGASCTGNSCCAGPLCI